jgi:hypothetical protein
MQNYLRNDILRFINKTGFNCIIAFSKYAPSFLINDDLKILNRRAEYNLHLYLHAEICKILKFKLLQTALHFI